MKKLILTSILAIGMVSCSSPKHIEEIKKDTVWRTNTEYVNQTITDSVFVHDSVFIKAVGDTIFEYRYKDRWHTSYIHDTLRVKDTLYLSKEQSTTVEKKDGHRFLKTFNSVMAVFGIAFIFILIIYFISKSNGRNKE